MPGGEGMAPVTQRRRGEGTRERPEPLRLLRRINLDTRQDDDGENRRGRNRGGGNRFGGGGGSNNNNDDDDSDGGGGGGGFRGGNNRNRGGNNRGGGGGNNNNNNNNNNNGGNNSGNNRGGGGNNNGGNGRNRGGNRNGGGGGGFGGGNRNGSNDDDDDDDEPEPATPTTEAASPPPTPTTAPEASPPPPATTAPAEVAPPPATTEAPPSEAAPTEAPTTEAPPAPAPTTVIQVSTMTVTPSAGDPNTVTTFIPLMTTEALAVVEGPVETPPTSTAGTDSSLPSPPPESSPPPPESSLPPSESSSPAPEVTALSDAGATSSSLPTEVSTSTLEPTNGLVEAPSFAPTDGLGEPPVPPTETGVSIGSAASTDAPQGMDPVAERAMISVGSIAAFVMVVSFGWMVYRQLKKRKNRDSKGSGHSSGSYFSNFFHRRASRLPFSKELPLSKEDRFSKDRPWEHLGDSVPIKDRPPTYKSGKAGGAKSVPLGGFYGHEKQYSYQMPSEKQERQEERPQLPRLQTTGIPPAAPHWTPQSSSSPRPLSSHPVSAMTTHPASAYPRSRGNVSADTTAPPTTILFSHQAQESFSSTNAAQFATMTPVSASSMRSKLGPGFLKEPEVARTPSARRQGNRTSELSSLSSGFGDGDIIVPADPAVPVPRAPSSVYPGGNGTQNNTRFSWQTQETSKRDTVYTQASEDMPPRFRTVNSWVDQQTGRIKRAQQREHNHPGAVQVPQMAGQIGIPGIHNPPNEQGYAMMMDDEQPRRVEDALPPRRQ